MTSVVELAKVLSPENREDMLPRFFHRSKREAAEVVAALQPRAAPPRREVVTAFPLAPPVAVAEATRVGAVGPTCTAIMPLSMASADETASHSVQLAEHPDANSPSASPALSSQPQKGATSGELLSAGVRRPRDMREATEPLTADLRRLHVTVSRRFLSKLDAARAALSHARPGASSEEILEAGLDLVLAQHAKRKGLVAKPRREPPPSNSDRVPAHVRRAVWTRDDSRCQWPVSGGGICGSTLRVELDHVVPRARGGPPTVENCRLLCRLHNQLSARLAFGNDWMDRFTRNSPERETGAG